jgi:hypothetical protein
VKVHTGERLAAGHASALRYFGRGGLIVLIAAVAGHVAMSYFEFLRYIEQRNFDRWIIWHTQPSPPELAVIDIDDAAWFNDFRGGGVLRQEMVQKLIEAADRGGAKVIGVDVDTRDWDPLALATLHTRAPVVWAAVPLGSYRSTHDGPWRKVRAFQRYCGSVAVERFHLDAVVRTMPGPRSLAAVMQLPARGRGCPEEERSEEPEEGDYIRFIQRPAEAGESVLRSAAAAYPADSVLEGAKPGMFQDQYVLIGGSFEDTADRHLTPFGETFGLDLQADILASQLTGPVRRAPEWLVIVSDIMFGSALLALLWLVHERPLWRWIALLAGAPAGSIALALWSFRGGLFISFLPILLGVILHEIIDMTLEQRELRCELAELKLRAGRSGTR